MATELLFKTAVGLTQDFFLFFDFALIIFHGMKNLSAVFSDLGFSNDQQQLTHTDRGSQYASKDYCGKIEEYKIVQSMSRKGNCYDNAYVESFFRTLKVELIYNRNFKTRQEAKKAIYELKQLAAA